MVERCCVAGAIGVVGERVVAGSLASDLARVVAPVESAPKPVQRFAAGPGVLHVRGLIEALVVIDAERQAGLADGGSCSSNLRREEARGRQTTSPSRQ